MKTQTWLPKNRPNNWQLTDHCVELVETEIGVVE